MLHRLTSALAIAAIAVAGLAAPAQAAPGAGTVAFQGDPGDYITQGTSYSYATPADRITLSGDAQHVALAIDGANGDWWYIDASAPTGQSLTAGQTYSAMRYPFTDPGLAGFDLSGNGRGCNTSTSTFTVQAITTDPAGTVTRFSATFEQHCEGGAAAARGQIDVGLTPPAPPLQLAVTNVSATLDSYGGVIVTGTLTCSSDAMTYVSGIVSQTTRKSTVSSSGGTYVDCWSGATYTWDYAVYAGGLDAFSAGAVTVSTTATANDAFTGQQVQSGDTDSYRLRRPRV